MTTPLTGLAMLAHLQRSNAPLRAGIVQLRRVPDFNAASAHFQERETDRGYWWGATSRRVINMSMWGATTVDGGWLPV